MASSSEGSSLLSILESSDDPKKIHALVSDHLHPFANLINPKKPSKKQTQADASTVRSLAKQFLSFLNKSLSILPKRLSKKNLDGVDLLPLFDTYLLCMDCLELVASQLACGAHEVQSQRLRLVYCLEAWGKYAEAEIEGFRVLERLKKGDSQGKLLPKFDNRSGGGDGDFGRVLVDAVATIVKCGAMRQGKDSGDYWRVLGLVEEVKPWFSVLDVNTHEKLSRVFATYLGKCSQLLIGEINCFDGDLVSKFCTTALTEYANSPIKDQIYKFARRICSYLFSQQGNKSSNKVDILKQVLDFIARKCKVDLDNGIEFVELVAYCASKSQTAGTAFCCTLANHLNDMAVDFPQATGPCHLIVRLYATGLDCAEQDAKSKTDHFSSSRGAEYDSDIKVLFLDGDKIQDISSLLHLLESYFCLPKETSIPSTVKYKDSVRKTESQASTACIEKNRNTYLSSYLHALRFLCQPLAEQINSDKKRLIAEIESSSVSSKLCGIQDAFYQFCYTILYHYRFSTEFDKAGLINDITILSIFVAGITLSVCTKFKMKENEHFIKQIITSKWVHPQGLKYLSACLYNIGVLLYRKKHTNEASKVLKLCYRTSWACVELLSRLFKDKSKGFSDHLTEDAVFNFISEACTRSASFFEILNQCDTSKVEKRILESLEYWSIAGKSFSGLPRPLPLVKQWVKMQCKLQSNSDLEDSAASLYTRLPSSVKVSKKTIGIIAEQELLAYEEMSPRYSDFCQRMQLKAIAFLLQDVYVTKERNLQKSSILIKKGKTLRANGIGGLVECMQCLSEAISIMKNMCDKTSMSGVALCHQLAAAYCLRALCTKENEPDSKKLFEDITAALDLLLSISLPDHCSGDNDFSWVTGNTVRLIFNILDLLAVKGCTAFHTNIYELIIRLSKQKNMPPEKFVATLWECRRLSHTLCVSPINEEFIQKLSEHYGENSKSIDFWMQCLGSSKPLALGLKQNLTFFFHSYTHAPNNSERDIPSSATIKDIKEVISDLISNDPLPSRSAFGACCLYLDLSERLVSNGRSFEALSCAKEAHKFCTQLFREKFAYTIEQEVEEHNGGGDVTPKIITCSPKNLHVLKSVACEVWSFETSSWDLDGFYLSPWNVLQRYLESTLQLGVIFEITGNGVEAETMLSWGKSISCLQSLGLFEASFSSVLGKLYRKKKLWDMAEKELLSAKQVLADESKNVTCLKCRLMLEVNVDLQLGDLYRSQFDSVGGNNLRVRLSQAKNLYRSALEKLNHSEWKNTTSCFNKESVLYSTTEQSDAIDVFGKLRKTKKVPKSTAKEKHLASEHGSRLTRSKYKLSQTTNQSIDTQVGLPEHSNSDFLSGDAPTENKSLMGRRDCLDENRDEVACICNNKQCWQCLHLEVMKSGIMSNYINIKWEFARRRLSAWVLSGVGKCLEFLGQSHEIHEAILQAISTLVGRNSFSQDYSSDRVTFLLSLIEKEFSGDAFAIEHAAILYNMSWFSLKLFHSKDSRILFCDLSHIHLSRIAFWLKLAFVLSREVPVLFQKVSRLLATMYILSASSKQFSLPSSCKALSESYWASYFHQASLGTHLNYQFFSIRGRFEAQQLIDSEVSFATSSTCLRTETSALYRLAPDSTEDLEQFVINFFEGLPRTSIICISLLGGALANLVKELLLYHSCCRAWLLLSRFSSENKPLVILTPADSVLEDNDDPSPDTWESIESLNSNQHWSCPWGSTVVDDLAPAFKMILEENYLSSSMLPVEDTKKNRSLWWMRRMKLDNRLGNLLRKLEDSWLGPWRYMLLGDYSNCKNMDSVHKKLMHDLKSKCKMDLNESLLKLFLGSAKDGFDETCLLQLCSKKGCFIGTNEQSSEPFKGSNKYSRLALQLIQEAVNMLNNEETQMREPIIIVFDSDVQMLPWESIPILRKQEVYRMPSVGSIFVTLDRIRHHQDEVGRMVAAFPLIDPLDAFFLLNPSGDLSNTQFEFEKWFKDQNFEGSAGSVPTAEELATALKSHDLFIYFGHGSGAQYISRHEIQKLENCAATLLMGCSSGSLSLNGCYIPVGTPLSYLLAGSPVIVANLWEVTDKDIDRFAKAILDAWLRARSDIADSNQLIKEFDGMHVSGRKGNAKKRVALKELPEGQNGSSLNVNVCENRPKIGSFMGKAREACTLPFLIGASPVCYGVPTGIWRKKDV